MTAASSSTAKRAKSSAANCSECTTGSTASAAAEARPARPADAALDQAPAVGLAHLADHAVTAAADPTIAANRAIALMAAANLHRRATGFRLATRNRPSPNPASPER